MTPTEAGLYGSVVLIALMFLKIPVGFVMDLVGFGGFAFLVSWDAALQLMAQDFFSVFGSYNLTVIPLFVIMGQIIFLSANAWMPWAQPMSACAWPGSTASANAGSVCRRSRTRRSNPWRIFRPCWASKGMRTSRGPFC